MSHFHRKAWKIVFRVQQNKTLFKQNPVLFQYLYQQYVKKIHGV